MKHVLVNEQGMVHAVILACPFKYTVPRNMKSYHDINHDFSKPFNATGKMKVDCYDKLQPKSQDDKNMHAMDFAIIRDGKIENVIVWGGAEWCPPQGTIMMPLEKWMGMGDLFDEQSQKFTIHNDRLGKSDKDKTVAELQADMDAVLNQDQPSE
jgi:hypothetical protein